MFVLPSQKNLNDDPLGSYKNPSAPTSAAQLQTHEWLKSFSQLPHSQEEQSWPTLMCDLYVGKRHVKESQEEKKERGMGHFREL